MANCASEATDVDRHVHEHHGVHEEAHAHEHDHSHDGPDRGDEVTLYSKIDIGNVIALNEDIPGSARTIIKPFSERMDTIRVQ